MNKKNIHTNKTQNREIYISIVVLEVVVVIVVVVVVVVVIIVVVLVKDKAIPITGRGGP
jgi:hypothetical protein